MKRKIAYSIFGIITLSLISLNVYLKAWDDGFKVGYRAALADVFLDVINPEDYFKEMLGIKK